MGLQQKYSKNYKFSYFLFSYFFSFCQNNKFVSEIPEE